MTDHILLEGLSFYGYHGVRQDEKSLGQRFVVNLRLGLDLALAGRSDDLALTVDYSEVHRVAKEIVEGPSRDTLEAVAEALESALMARFARLDSVKVRLTKPSATIAGATFQMVGVEINRGRSQAGG